MPPERSRRPLKSVITIVGVLALVAMFAAGVVSFLPGGFDRLTSRTASPEVAGEILWDSDDLAVQLGPAGWLTHPGEGGDYEVRNVRTGESWTVGDLDSGRVLTADGVVVQDVEGRVVIQRDGATVSAKGQDIVDAVGDADLWPGKGIDPVGVSAEHVAVLTCLASTPSRLSDEVEGGRQILAGIDLADASVSWTHDTGVACGPGVTPAYYPKTLPAQDYVLIETAEDARHAVDLDTGKVARRWTDTRRRELTVHGDHVLEPAGQDAVAYRSLATGKVAVTVECERARAGDPQHISRQLAPEVTPFVECRDSVRLIDDGEVVDTHAGPADGASGTVGSQPVAVGRTVMQRTSQGVELTDGLTGKSVGTIDVPEDFEIAGYGPVGRLIAFVDVTEGSGRNTVDYRVFDATTADLVLSAGPGMGTGADVSPDGLVLVDVDEDFVDEDQPRTWLAGPKETS